MMTARRRKRAQAKSPRCARWQPNDGGALLWNVGLRSLLKPCYTSPEKGVRIGPSTVDVRKRFDNEFIRLEAIRPRSMAASHDERGRSLPPVRNRLPVEPDARKRACPCSKEAFQSNPVRTNCLCSAVHW